MFANAFMSLEILNISAHSRGIESEQSGEVLAQFDQAEVDPRTSCDHDDIERLLDLITMLPEPLANPAFEPIALYGGSGLAADRDPEATPWRFPGE